MSYSHVLLMTPSLTTFTSINSNRAAYEAYRTSKSLFDTFTSSEMRHMCGGKKYDFILAHSKCDNKPTECVHFPLFTIPLRQAPSSFFTISTVTAWVCVCNAKQAHKGRQCDDYEKEAAMTGKKQILSFFYPQTNKIVEREILSFFWSDKKRGVEKFILRFTQFCGEGMSGFSLFPFLNMQKCLLEVKSFER